MMIHQRLDPEIGKKWIDALRSGQYKQGKSALCKNSCYCCLGVLAEVMGATWNNGYPLLNDQPAGSSCYLAHDIIQKVGLTYGEQKRFALMNDQGVSFENIALELESRL